MGRKQTVYVVSGKQKVSWVFSPRHEALPKEIKCSRDLAVGGVLSNLEDYLRDESLDRDGPLSRDGRTLDLDNLYIEECRFDDVPFPDIEDGCFAPLREGGKVPFDQFKDILRRKMEAMDRLATEVYISTDGGKGFCEIKVRECKM